ncbi:MAG: hypothetical protein IV100_31560 [Myxococcales bacterium]|nr:hypothetical protein [Myxococcales bacterium]
MMKRPIATLFASLLGLTAVGACAVGGHEAASEATSEGGRYGQSAATAQEGLVFDDSDGVTDEEAYSVDLPSGSTDSAFAIKIPAEVGSKADAATCIQTGSVVCAPNSTGAGVQHGSPQPLDPTTNEKVQQVSLQGR